jgi:hypothetical protein
MVPGGGGRCCGGRVGGRCCGGSGILLRGDLLGLGENTRYLGIVLFSNARNPILECSILLTYRTA